RRSRTAPAFSPRTSTSAIRGNSGTCWSDVRTFAGPIRKGGTGCRPFCLLRRRPGDAFISSLPRRASAAACPEQGQASRRPEAAAEVAPPAVVAGAEAVEAAAVPRAPEEEAAVAAL